MSLGFSHLGHFAHAYHVRFGELPSETVAWAKRKTLRMAAQEVAPIPASKLSERAAVKWCMTVSSFSIRLPVAARAAAAGRAEISVSGSYTTR